MNTTDDINLCNDIDHYIHNENALKGRQYMSTQRFVSIQCNTFKELTDLVTSVIKGTRKWYIKTTVRLLCLQLILLLSPELTSVPSHLLSQQGAHQAFISVGHDVLDGKCKKINGLTIFYTHPDTLVMQHVPIAPTPSSGGSAIELCKIYMLGLERVQIEFDDLSRSVNNNCTTAKKTGML